MPHLYEETSTISDLFSYLQRIICYIITPNKIWTGLNTSQHKCNKEDNKNYKKNCYIYFSSSTNITYPFTFIEKLLKILVYNEIYQMSSSSTHSWIFSKEVTALNI